MQKTYTLTKYLNLSIQNAARVNEISQTALVHELAVACKPRAFKIQQEILQKFESLKISKICMVGVAKPLQVRLFPFSFCSCHFVSDIHFKIITCREGIWDMIRVDHGTEACLMVFVQNLLRNERGNLGCELYVQTQSREVSTLFIFFS